MFCVGLLMVMTGCALPEDFRFRDLELHGKVGAVCGVSSGVVIGIPLCIVSLPVTLPLAAQSHSRNKWFGGFEVLYPAYFAVLIGYYGGAALAYPLHLVVEEVPHRVRLALSSDEELVHYLVKSMPHISESDYDRLVEASGRRNPPAYGGYNPVFGEKPICASTEEWQAWLQAGGPAGGQEKAP